MKKRVAIQFFGNIRTYKNCYKSLKKNIFDLYDCDVFMHTWDTVDHDTKTWHKHKIKNNKNNAVKEETLKNYYPLIKKLKIESSKDLGFDLNGEFYVDNRTFSLLGVRSMYYSMEKSNELREVYEKENNINYDYVILIRPDLKLLEPLVIDDYINYQNINSDNSIYTSKLCGEDLIVNDGSFIRGVDLIMFAKPECMSKLFKNNNLDQQINAVKNKKVNNGPEKFMHNLANDNGLTLRITNYSTNISFDIIRKVKVISLKNIISLRIRKNMLKLSLMPKIDNVFKISISLLNGKFTVDCAVGKINQERI